MSKAVPTTFVLMNGTGHGGRCWCFMAPMRLAAGCNVYIPTLIGLGASYHLLHEHNRIVRLMSRIKQTRISVYSLLVALPLPLFYNNIQSTYLFFIDHLYGNMRIWCSSVRVSNK